MKLFSENKSFEETKRVVSILQKNGSASFSNILESIELDEIDNKFYPTIANKYINAVDSSVFDDIYNSKYLDLFLNESIISLNTSEDVEITEKISFLESRFNKIYNIEKEFYKDIVDISK
ncbi:hypothetical protein [Acinetobacter oleivorans]|uniref:hypothetical protein n=1 Tax=Acinetobacter oleivorans TaxID=1148157 RepID=UPI001230FE93|nr:hypothetical protein [Acinetobacter oleivorans]